MSFVVKLETPPGNPTTSRHFNPGDTIRVGEHVTSLLGGPAWGVDIQVDISSTGGDFFESLYASDKTNMLGDAWQDFILPNVNSKADIRVTASFGSTTPETVIVPIAIGNATPDPLPIPKPVPNELLNTILFGALGIAVLYVVLKARK